MQVADFKWLEIFFFKKSFRVPEQCHQLKSKKKAKQNTLCPPLDSPALTPSQNKDDVENDRTSFQKKREARRRKAPEAAHVRDEELVVMGRAKDETWNVILEKQSEELSLVVLLWPSSAFILGSAFRLTIAIFKETSEHFKCSILTSKTPTWGCNSGDATFFFTYEFVYKLRDEWHTSALPRGWVQALQHSGAWTMDFRGAGMHFRFALLT